MLHVHAEQSPRLPLVARDIETERQRYVPLTIWFDRVLLMMNYFLGPNNQSKHSNSEIGND